MTYRIEMHLPKTGFWTELKARSEDELDELIAEAYAGSDGLATFKNARITGFRDNDHIYS